jgi:ketosteroid isomerase-like protein
MDERLPMSDVPQVIRTFLSAWSERDPSLAAASVTDDVVIHDPSNDVTGPSALVEHLEVILRRFDFAITYGPCLCEGDRVAFTCRIDMTGRSSRLAGVRTGFEPAIFVQLRDGRIASWTEYWDPAPLARDLAAGATG